MSEWLRRKIEERKRREEFQADSDVERDRELERGERREQTGFKKASTDEEWEARRRFYRREGRIEEKARKIYERKELKERGRLSPEELADLKKQRQMARIKARTEGEKERIKRISGKRLGLGEMATPQLYGKRTGARTHAVGRPTPIIGAGRRRVRSYTRYDPNTGRYIRVGSYPRRYVARPEQYAPEEPSEGMLVDLLRGRDERYLPPEEPVRPAGRPMMMDLMGDGATRDADTGGRGFLSMMMGSAPKGKKKKGGGRSAIGDAMMQWG